MPTLADTAKALVAPGMGILAADESEGTIAKRFAVIGLPVTFETRRDYREMLFRAREAMTRYITGAILTEETLMQNAADGTPFVALLVSGTASIVGHETVHAGDVRAQTLETLLNLRTVIQAANARGSAVFDLRELDCVVYVRHARDLPVVRAVFEDAVGAGSPAARGAVYLRADICRSDLLVEIEAHGFATGVLRAAPVARGVGIVEARTSEAAS